MTQLHYIHDPLCGWCYAAAPLIAAAREHFGERLGLHLHAGALFAEPRRLDTALAAHILHTDQHIAQLSGQPFGQAYIEGLLAEHGTMLYSLPPITAQLAVVELVPALAYPMLEAIQQAHYQRGLRVSEPPVLTELAEDLGLAGSEFEAAFERQHETPLAAHVEASRKLLHEVGGQGFPTLVLEHDGERQRLDHTRYYGQPAAFIDWLARVIPALH